MNYKSYCILHFACTLLCSNTETRNWVYLFEQNITWIRIQFICMEALLTAKHNFKWRCKSDNIIIITIITEPR